jgi:succinoglycan biosynthesis transport protein ExoP
MGPEKTQLPPISGAFEQPQAVSGTESADSSLAEAVATLRKRLWIIILAAVLGISYGWYKAHTQPKVFVAASTIQVHNGSANAYKLTAMSDYSDDSQTKMNTELIILKSDTLMHQVAMDMDLENNPDFWGAEGQMPHRDLDDPPVREQVIRMLQGSLQVSLVPRTELISISYASLSPKLSADIVNNVIQAYINRSFTTPAQRTRIVGDWLSNSLADLKAKVEKSQEEMMQVERKLGVLGYDTGRNQLQASLEDLLSAEGSAKIARITAESRYRMIQGMDPNTLEGTIETTPGTVPGELSSLRAQLATLKATYSQLSTTLDENHPKLRAIRDQMAEISKEIDTEQNRMKVQARENFHAAAGTEAATQKELDARKREAYEQGDDLVRYTLLKREYEQDRTLYDGLQQRLQTASIEAGLDALEVDQIDKALPPISPTLRPALSIITSTTLFFVLGAVVIAFVVEGLDTRLHNIQEIEQLIGLPSLAVVPRSKRASAEQTAGMSTAQRNINVLSQPKSQFTEAFRSLQTSLLLASAGKPPQYILFTSATPSEGKTTTASNLACILAQGDSRVLLVDADLRRPSLHHRFGLTGKLGLTTVLAGTSPVEEALQRLPELPNLDILPSGPVPPFPTEMLSSEAMRALLERFGSIYKYIIIDSPPILSVTDAVILSRVVDAVVLVVRHGKSNKNIMRRTRDLLIRSGAPIAGLVLNAVDLNSPEYYGYYGYSGYSYGSMDGDSWATQEQAKDEAVAEGKVKR